MPTPFSAAGARISERLQRSLNQILDYDPDTRAELGKLEGRVIAIEISEPSVDCYLLPGSDGLRLVFERPPRVDVTITGRPLALLGMLTRRETAQGHVEIRGDIHLAQRFQQIMQQLDIDWEEFLAGHIGDVAAHQLGRVGRGLQHRLRTIGVTLRRQVDDYMQYEQQRLPLRHELDDFSHAVDELRDALARAEQRLQRVQKTRDIPS